MCENDWITESKLGDKGLTVIRNHMAKDKGSSPFHRVGRLILLLTALSWALWWRDSAKNDCISIWPTCKGRRYLLSVQSTHPFGSFQGPVVSRI